MEESMKRWLLAAWPRFSRHLLRRRVSRASRQDHRSAHARRLAGHDRARHRPGLSGVWTQPVVVENRTGGSQNIGSDLVAKSPPDGYTWLLAPDNVFSVNPYLGKQPFDPLVDLMPVTQVARIQFLLVVNSDLPAKSVPELIALAKSKPGELNFGSSGNGSPQHLGATMFQVLTGTKMNHVPYRVRRRPSPTCCRAASRCGLAPRIRCCRTSRKESCACSAIHPPSRKPFRLLARSLAWPVRAGEDAAGGGDEDPRRGW
jgi:hypothetical protein